MLATGVSHGKKPTSDIPESTALTKRYSRITNGKATSFALGKPGGNSHHCSYSWGCGDGQKCFRRGDQQQK